MQTVPQTKSFRFFDEKVEELKNDVQQFGEICISTIEHALKALESGDVKLAETIIFADDAIDAWHAEIQKKCFDLLATVPALARDVWKIGMFLQVITDLERIADHATDIAQLVYFFEQGDKDAQPNTLRLPPVINQMAVVVRRMLAEALRSFTDTEASKIINLGDMDDAVDERLWEILQGVNSGGAQQRCPTAVQIIVGCALERAADHATNIGEWVLYAKTGRLQKINGRDPQHTVDRWREVAQQSLQHGQLWKSESRDGMGGESAIALETS